MVCLHVSQSVCVCVSDLAQKNDICCCCLEVSDGIHKEPSAPGITCCLKGNGGVCLSLW